MRYDSYDVNPSWTRFLHSSAASEHAVQVYAHVDELAESVVAYLSAGFELGEPAVVVSTPDHWSVFAERLEACGWGAARLEETGLLARADAEETLELLLEDGRPSARRFDEVVGGLIDGISGRFPDKHVRAFGEMVDVLCLRGDRQAAAELEDLWNRAAKRRKFALLCGYQIDVFDAEAQLSLLPQICGAHTHVLPAPDLERLRSAVDAALQEELGPEAGVVYAETAHGLGSKWLPAPERAMMWVSANMPGRAQRILATARERYAAAAAG